jgi:hypothetical protein
VDEHLWVGDTGERYIRTLVSVFCSQFTSFLVQDWIASRIWLSLFERAGVWASTSVVTCLFTTVVMAWVARHYGQYGTASFLKWIGYHDRAG